MIYSLATKILSENSVAVNEVALSPLVELVRKHPLPSWAWYLPKDCTPSDAFKEFVFNAGMNGGYFYNTGCGTKQWEVKGSGARALMQWIEDSRSIGCMPLLQTGSVTPELKSRLLVLPYGIQRVEFAEQLCLNGGKLEELRLKIHKQGFVSDLEVDVLCELFPAGFGGDPFKKKACLAMLEYVGWMNSSGVKLEYSLPIPSDYQIPRILLWNNVISISEQFREKLVKGDFLDPLSKDVMLFRAAAIVACRKLALLSGLTDNYVDGALFETFRKSPGFIATALPAMRCDCMWF